MTAYPRSCLPRRAAGLAAPAILAALLAAGSSVTLARCGADAPALMRLPPRPAPAALPVPAASAAAVASRWKPR